MSDKGSIFDHLRAIFGKKTQTPPPTVPKVKEPASEPAKPPQPRPSPPPPQHSPSAPRIQYLPQPQPPVNPDASASSSLPGVDLVLGIDFGTSCTKVVIGDPGWRAKSYPVPLMENAQGLSRFLVPSRLKFKTSEDRQILYGNLKMRLMEEPDDEGIRELAALYLASIIRHSLDWFKRNLNRHYAARQPSWSLNLGFPAKSVDAATPLVKAYREVARLAVLLGTSDLALSLQSISQVSSGKFSSDFASIIPPDRIQIYPEIAAQLASYVNSPYRLYGNLLLVDVGAGTLDVSTLILHADKEQEICSFHFCEVARFGTVPLIEARVAAMNAETPNCAVLDINSVQDGISAAPEQPTGLLRAGQRISPCLTKAFNEASGVFADGMIQVALRCLTQFKVRQRDAHANPSFNPWPGHLRFFLTGGGSRSSFYRKHFAEGRLESELAPFTRWHRDAGRRAKDGEGLRLDSLPLPKDLEGFPESLKNDFDRLSVAHGLAYGAENLMHVTASATS